MSKKDWITAAEHEAQLWRNPEWVARHLENETRLKERQEQARREQAVLVQELNNAGVRVECVYDLVNTADKYPAAIPILLRHLTLHLVRSLCRYSVSSPVSSFFTMMRRFAL